MSSCDAMPGMQLTHNHCLPVVFVDFVNVCNCFFFFLASYSSWLGPGNVSLGQHSQA